MDTDDKILATAAIVAVICALALVTIAVSTSTPLFYECGVNTYC